MSENSSKFILPQCSLILGGARSGKSHYAEKLTLNAATSSGLDKTYLATGQAFDAEMQDRINKHQSRRGSDWHLIEEPLHLAERLVDESKRDRLILVDCLTLWLSNLYMQEKSVETEIDHLLHILPKLPNPVIFVANEVGLGIVPDNKLARSFRDSQGELNQKLASLADYVVFMAAGLAMTLKSPGDSES